MCGFFFTCTVSFIIYHFSSDIVAVRIQLDVEWRHRILVHHFFHLLQTSNIRFDEELHMEDLNNYLIDKLILFVLFGIWRL